MLKINDWKRIIMHDYFEVVSFMMNNDDYANIQKCYRIKYILLILE